ncbi:MAG: aspartate kinase [Aggregatilineales bacterium]
MSGKTLVMKFGGSLTADARSIRRVAQVVLAEALAWEQMAVVVSAMAGATDTLARAVNLAVARDSAGSRQAVSALRIEHAAVVDALFPESTARLDLMRRLDHWLFDALAVCDGVAMRREATARDRDAALVIGERLIAEIVIALVQHEGLRSVLIDSAEWLRTDEHFQNANPVMEAIEERVERAIRPALAAGLVVVTPGFIGATRTNAPTTLGRGGSDYTATLLAAALHANEVWMWSRVDGIMSADPSLVPDAQVLETLSYDDIRELSFFGVRVLHPRAVEPLLPDAIPMRVRNPFRVEHAGTLIRAQAAGRPNAVSAIDGLLLNTHQPGIDLPGFLAQVNHEVGQAAAGPVIVTQSQAGASLVFVVPTSEGPAGAAQAVHRLALHLPDSQWTVRTVKVIAALNSGRAAFTTDVPILAYAHGPGERRLFAVAPEDMPSTVRQLHRQL